MELSHLKNKVFGKDSKYRLRLGMRTIKTGISVLIVVILSSLLHRDTPAIMALSSIVTMKENPQSTWKYGKLRMFANILGSFFAIIFVLTFHWFPNAFLAQLFLLPLGVMSIIIFCDSIHKNEAIVVATSTFLVILVVSANNLSLAVVFQRIIDTFIGSFVSIIINSLLPTHDAKK